MMWARIRSNRFLQAREQIFGQGKGAFTEGYSVIGNTAEQVAISHISA